VSEWVTTWIHVWYVLRLNKHLRAEHLTQHSVFFVTYKVRLKTQFSFNHVIQHNTRWQHPDR